MAPLPQGNSLPHGGSIPSRSSNSRQINDEPLDKDDVIQQLFQVLELQKKLIRHAHKLEERLTQSEMRADTAEDESASMRNIISSMQGEMGRINNRAVRAENTANEAWLGTALLALCMVASPLAKPLYNGACWAGRTAKVVVSSAKATLSSYGITGILVTPPLALGAPV